MRHPYGPEGIRETTVKNDMHVGNGQPLARKTMLERNDDAEAEMQREKLN